MFPNMIDEELSHVCCNVVVFLHGISISILENMLTTTKIMSCWFLEVGYLVKYSIEIDSHGQLGTGRGV